MVQISLSVWYWSGPGLSIIPSSPVSHMIGPCPVWSSLSHDQSPSGPGPSISMDQTGLDWTMPMLGIINALHGYLKYIRQIILVDT